MNWLLPILILIVAVAFLILKKRNAPVSDEGESFPYILGGALFTPAERSFLGVLDQAVGTDFRVFGKVRVADVIEVAKGTPKPLRQRAFNRINAKHFDFVLCSPSDLKPLCAIELNDQSHAQDNRKERDKFLENVCTAAKFPLVFFPAQRSYTLAEICQAIAEAIGPGRPVPATMNVASEAQSSASCEAPEVVCNTATDPVCPRCSSPMVRRVAKSGENTGKEFWGCTKFPACRGMVHL